MFYYIKWKIIHFVSDMCVFEESHQSSWILSDWQLYKKTICKLHCIIQVFVIIINLIYASKCSRIFSLFCLIFSDIRMLFFRLSFIKNCRFANKNEWFLRDTKLQFSQVLQPCLVLISKTIIFWKNFKSNIVIKEKLFLRLIMGSTNLDSMWGLKQRCFKYKWFFAIHLQSLH